MNVLPHFDQGEEIGLFNSLYSMTLDEKCNGAFMSGLHDLGNDAKPQAPKPSETSKHPITG